MHQNKPHGNNIHSLESDAPHGSDLSRTDVAQKRDQVSETTRKQAQSTLRLANAVKILYT